MVRTDDRGIPLRHAAILTLATALFSGGFISPTDAEDPSHRSLTPEAIHQICQDTMNLANAGRLQDHFVKFRPAAIGEDAAALGLHSSNVLERLDIDYDGDGIPERLAIVSDGGSCGSFEIIDVDDARRDIWAYRRSSHRYADDDDEYVRWASWGYADRLVFIDGEPIVLASRNWQSHADTSLASWIGDGGVMPICAFQFTGKISATTITGQDDGLCEALVAGNVEAPAWGQAMHLSREAQAGLKSYYDAIRIADIDLNQDGKLERIAELSLASGAGCGSDHRWFTELEADGLVASDTLLNHVLAAQEWGAPYPQDRADQTPLPDAFLYEGKAYLLGDTPAEHTGVYSFENGGSHLRCEIDRIPQVRIVREYPVGP